MKEVLTIGKVCWEVREAIEGRADWDLVARRRRGDRSRDLAARRARGDPRARRGRPGALADRVDDRDPRTTRAHRAQRRRHARGDAGRGDHRPRRPGPRGARRAARARDRATGSCPSCSPTPTRRRSTRSASRRPRRSSPTGPARESTAVLDGARLAVSLRRTRAVHLTRLRNEVDLPMLYVPYLFSRTPRAARDADGGRGAEPGARAVTHVTSLESLLAAKEIVVCCGSGGVGKTTVAAVGRARCREPARRQGARAHDRPGQAARRRARPRGHRQRREAGARRGVQDRRARGPRRAVGRDARHQAVVGRAGAAPRARRGDRVPDPRQPHVREHHRALRAEPRLHRDGAAVRDPRDRQVRPHHHRHPADPERARLPRRAEAHGRVLRRPAAALAHDAVPGGRQARRADDQRREPALLPNGRSAARQPVPPGHLRVLPELPVDVPGLRRAGASRSSGCCTTGARRSRSSRRSSRRRCTRPSSSASS